MNPRRTYPPLSADHPVVRDRIQCLICGQPFATGDVTTLIEMGPIDAESAARARDGQAYNASARVVHATCRPPADLVLDLVFCSRRDGSLLCGLPAGHDDVCVFVRPAGNT